MRDSDSAHGLRVQRRLIAVLGCMSAWLTGLAEAQVLQDGDLVVAANDQDGFGNWQGRIFRLRGGSLSLLAPCAALPTELVIDQEGRVVFTASGCNSNANNMALYRLDPETGVVELLACFPYTVSPGSIPTGIPDDAVAFRGLRGLHVSRKLSISIDDDVSGGRPQLEFAEVYGISVGVGRQGGGGSVPFSTEAFDYLVDEARFEEGVSLMLLSQRPSGALIVPSSAGTWYSGGDEMGRARPDLHAGLHLKTKIYGLPVSLSATLDLAGKNELLWGQITLDNTDRPNVTVTCSPLIDDNVPEYNTSFSAFTSVTAFGILNGAPVALSNHFASYPYMFSLAPRDPFLNPFTCGYAPAVQAYAPLVGVPMVSSVCVDGSRILGGTDTGGQVIEVTTTGYHPLASGMGRPRGVALYPPPTPPVTSAALVIRVDAGNDNGSGAPPVDVLVVDAAGRRIGRRFDGQDVNDFGDRGAILDLGPAGRIRVLAILDPEPGAHSLQVIGRQAGSYEIRGYYADTSAGGAFATLNGRAQPGSIQGLAADLTPPLGFTLRRTRPLPIH